ncbi:MAG TPA: hypothetical protein VK574_19385 [Terracidiphilus sp.]|nr:hypothetical protein [Terracidiphilus sp.]
MPVFSPAKSRRALVAMLICSTPCVFAQPGPPQDGQNFSDAHPVLATSKISELAHRVMEAGVKANALAGDDLKPWHMKVDFQVIPLGAKKPVNGTMEEWHLGPSRWARTFKSPEQRLTGSQWSVAETEQYQSKPNKVGFDHRLLVLRVARPVIDPLYQTANIKPEYEMDVKRVTTTGVKLNCVSVIDPQRYADQANPDWLFPTMCFDSEYHLRLTAASDTTVQFEDLQPFEGQMVARDVKVVFNGALIAEMKVTLLESLGEASGDLVKPAKDSIPEPYTIEPGRPKPVSIHEVGASVPIQPNGFPFRGSFPIPITIHKDGTVKARNEDTSPWSQELKDALVRAIDKWKYKPYLVNGQPVDVAWTVVYIIDGKPFVPSYERTEPQVAPAQQDSPPGSSPTVARRRYGH